MVINIKDYLKENNFQANSNNNDDNELIKTALKLIIKENSVSISFLQRKLCIGFAKASRIIEKMEELKYISKANGINPRKVFITQEEFNKIYGEQND